MSNGARRIIKGRQTESVKRTGSEGRSGAAGAGRRENVIWWLPGDSNPEPID
jgi:hypothetical protein